MNCDLHIHSNYSTGSQSLEEIIREAYSKGISLISITDDDTTEAYKELPSLVEKMDIAYIRGLQITSSMGGRFFRVLSYDFDLENQELQELLVENRHLWDALGERLIEVLSPVHPELTVEGYRNHRKTAGCGGFKHNSYIASVGMDGSDEGASQLFMEHREKMMNIMNNLEFRPIQEVISTVHGAGGKVIIPGGYLRDEETFNTYIGKLTTLGVDGLEVFSGSNDKTMQKRYHNYAQENGLLITGGGDGHGKWINQKKCAIGIRGIKFNELNLGDIKVYP